MAKIRAKLRELRNAEVKFISLVDRAATRIPFRVLKREDGMSIDLTRLVKRDPDIEIAGIVVFAQPDTALADEVRQSIATAGFSTDRVVKSDEETVVYPQSDSMQDVQVVRLSGQTIAAVRGLPDAPGLLGEIVKDQGFYPGPEMALSVAHDHVMELIQKDELAAISPVLQDTLTYLRTLFTLPAKCFKADLAINTVLAKQEQGEVHGLQPHKKKPRTVTEEKIDDKDEDDTTVCKECGKKKKIMKDGEEPVCETCVASTQKVEGIVVAESSVDTPAVEPEQKSTEAPVQTEETPVQKSDVQTILEAMASLKTDLQTQVSTVAQKVDTIVMEQQEQKKVLDGVVQKADTLESKLTTTISAQPNPPDRPARETAQKVDNDPRTGCFDTAFLRRRR